ncbi:hypothetical protein SEA_YARA_17 [Streptomyces phage Yara]|nr:hypothetical protein SEA_YARA_17 [Streptomyces phage Yara]
MAALTTTPILPSVGRLDTVAALVAAASLGDSAEVGSGKFLAVNNGGGSPITVTIATPGTAKGFAIADGTYVVAAGKLCLVPLNDVFRGGDGRAAITYSGVTSVTVGVFDIGTVV